MPSQVKTTNCVIQIPEEQDSFQHRFKEDYQGQKNAIMLTQQIDKVKTEMNDSRDEGILPL